MMKKKKIVVRCDSRFLFVSSMNDNICTHTYTYTHIHIHAELFRCRTMIINYNFSSIRDIESVEHTSEFFIFPERFRLEVLLPAFFGSSIGGTNNGTIGNKRGMEM